MARLTRRRFLRYGAAGGAALFVPWRFDDRARAVTPGFARPTLPGREIPKYRSPLIVPPAMPRTRRIRRPGTTPVDYYEIAVRQFHQRILPRGLPRTKVWSYGSIHHPASFNYPAFTVEARWRTPVRVKWINDLKDPSTGHFLPHLLPVDPTLHWAN